MILCNSKTKDEMDALIADGLLEAGISERRTKVPPRISKPRFYGKASGTYSSKHFASFKAFNWCLPILGNNTSFVFCFVAIFVSQERFLLWKMTPEHLTDCERNMSHNMSQVGNTWKYYQWSFIVLHIFQIPVYIIYYIY